ncbi:MAG: hypothetical protein DRP68_07330, partial [Candidatus Omnitrophota bacterium]
MIKPKDFRLRVIIILGIVILSFFYIWPLTTKINLGLDLKGGMYVVLKVDTSKVPKEKIAQAT